MTVEEILKDIPDKRLDKNTTSLKFKKDVIEFFKAIKLNKCVEVGSHSGYSTRILSSLFNEVYSIDHNMSLIRKSMELNKDKTNITYLCGDVYGSDWGLDGEFDVAFIDCVHTYDAVQHDIYKSLDYGVSYIIFDDYGIDLDMKRSIDDFIKTNENFEVTYIGEPKGNEPRIGKILHDWEGVIVKVRTNG
jgi:hypothetical protein